METVVLKYILFSLIAHVCLNEKVEEFFSNDKTPDINTNNDIPKSDIPPHLPGDDFQGTFSGKDQTNENVLSPKEVVLANLVNETQDSSRKTILNNLSTNSSNNTDVSEGKPNITNIVACNTGKENSGQPVELVNSTRLIGILVSDTNVTDRRTNADCTLVLFYARYCPFSSMAAPHFNALPRVFPDIKHVAVDAMKYHRWLYRMFIGQSSCYYYSFDSHFYEGKRKVLPEDFNTQYGIVGVPTVMLFHNGRPAAKFNESEYHLDAFAKFISKYTGIQPHEKLFVTSADFGGPVSSVPAKETDYCLVLSWLFILICSMYFFSKSSWWQWISEAIQNTWREAEAQHEHGD